MISTDDSHLPNCRSLQDGINDLELPLRHVLISRLRHPRVPYLIVSLTDTLVDVPNLYCKSPPASSWSSDGPPKRTRNLPLRFRFKSFVKIIVHVWIVGSYGVKKLLRLITTRKWLSNDEKATRTRRSFLPLSQIVRLHECYLDERRSNAIGLPRNWSYLGTTHATFGSQ